MKKWLKSLFRGNSLNEIEEEIDETPSEARVFTSHSIEKKNNEYERPNFRFPLELDDDIPIKQEEQEVEPVFHQPKNYDFWQNQQQTITRLKKDEIEPTYNDRTHYSNKEALYTYEKENVSYITEQVEPPVQEKEEKVDIVFRPKRKTPFRPSEYISPIYGYQKPVNTNQDDHNEVSNENEETNTASYENQFTSNSNLNGSAESVVEIEAFNQTNKLEETVEMTNQVHQVNENQNVTANELEDQQDEINNLDILSQEKLSQEILTEEIVVEVTNEVNELPIKTENENIVEKEISIEQPDITVHIESDQLQEKRLEENLVQEAESSNEPIQTEEKEEIDEFVNDVQEFVEIEEVKEEVFVSGQSEVESELFVSEQLEVESEVFVSEQPEVENEIFVSEQSEVESEVSVSEQSEVESEVLVSEQSEVENGVFVSEKPEVENEVSLSDQTTIEEVVPSIEESNSISAHVHSDEKTIQTDEVIEATEQKEEVKREKKRHFPFNVMMLRSDVEAARKANIMRQLRQLQNETAVTVEKVNETPVIEERIDELDAPTKETVQVSEAFMNENPSNELVTIEEVNNPTDSVNHVVEIEDEKVEHIFHPINETIQIESTIIQEVQEKSEFVEDTSNTELTNSNQTTLEKVAPIVEPEIPVMPPVLYELPGLDLLNEPPFEQFNDGDWVESQKELLQETLHNFNVGARVIAATQGPTVTRFEVQPDPGVKVNKITNLQDDIKLSLAARDIRIEAPIPGRSAIGIEVPNRESKPVYLRELVSKEKFLQSDSPLTVALGLDIGGEPVYADIAKMPHGLIAGATGSGKSVCINSILVSILYKAKPHEVKLILIDPKMVELAPYNHIPHLLSPVITDARAATAALKWACDEMDRRYDLFAHAGARDIKRYNDLARKKGAFNDELPYLVIIIDELADLMMVSPGDVETYICRIAQKARACGIHLLVATQRPSVDVITGIIKSNIPTRIAFTVSSQVDSRTIIDIGGAEKLLGRGDMLFLDNGKSQAVRLQGVFVSDDEIEQVVEIVKDQQKPNYLFNQEELVAKADAHDVDDELFGEAVEFVIDQKGASVSMLQRRFRIGYNRAARLVDLMYDHGIVSNQNGSKPRDILVTLEEFRSEET
ncbi:DNA translocase FtsK [Bacillus sp. EAC]|uniref:DNA translocase FtsK n=1 Tax=Bacillus sp. EAC TaxID=1978338 RepID=UPI000B435380|nr:DNA translocase FtsK [Bacillus sp. EAC]